MQRKGKLKRLTFWGIMLAAMGPSVFSRYQWLGFIVCMCGITILIATRVLLWKSRQSVP